MEQSVITPETHKVLVAKLETILDRKLTGMEDTIVEYVVEQVRLGLAEVK